MGKTRKNHAMHKMTLDSFCAAIFAGVLSISAFAAAGTAAGPLEVEFDTSGAPELEKWTNEKLAPVVREWYPKLVEMFPSEGWRPHRKVVFCFKEGIDCPAYASGPKVITLRSWFKDNPDDIGCAIHELFHVVQGGYRKAPKWLVEGFYEDLPKHGVGAFSELYDGDPPHEPHGAISSALSTAALLRVDYFIHRYEEKENRR